MLAAHAKQASHIRSLVSFLRSQRYLHHRRLATQIQHQIPASVDDKALITLFDNPSAGFRKSPFSVTGLFGHPNLIHSGALISLAEATVIRAQLLTDRILRARESRDELLKVVKNLDRLSDLLCAVIDLSELVRNAHPDRIWVDAANKAYETLCEFMNVLNTHVGLYEVCQVLTSSYY
jgi:intermediate peptidase